MLEPTSRHGPYMSDMGCASIGVMTCQKEPDKQPPGECTHRARCKFTPQTECFPSVQIIPLVLGSNQVWKEYNIFFGRLRNKHLRCPCEIPPKCTRYLSRAPEALLGTAEPRPAQGTWCSSRPRGATRMCCTCSIGWWALSRSRILEVPPKDWVFTKHQQPQETPRANLKELLFWGHQNGGWILNTHDVRSLFLRVNGWISGWGDLAMLRRCVETATVEWLLEKTHHTASTCHLH